MMLRTDARVSGNLYRGELWEIRNEEWILIYVTPKQYRTVEDAAYAANAYINEFKRTGRRLVKVA